MAMDQCDRCGAKALRAVRLESGKILLFCGHHFFEHETALRKAGCVQVVMAVAS
jgi:hypothetical protein